MSQAELSLCPQCGNPVRQSDTKAKQKTCSRCLEQRRIRARLNDEHITRSFATLWARGLYRRLGIFLEARKVPPETQIRMLSKAEYLFQEAEGAFSRLEQVSEEWLEDAITKAGEHLAPTFFRAFLREEHLLSAINQDEKKIQATQAKIEHLPAGYQRLVEVYLKERIALRERHVRLNAKHPLTAYTISRDFDMLARLIRWLTEYQPGLTGWDMVHEEHLYAYLLTLPPVERELTRKKLYKCFCLARKRRIIAHVPLMDLPSRAQPLCVSPLLMQEQKRVAKLIRNNICTSPEEAFLSALCFYHGMTSLQICHLKTHDVDVERGIIHIVDRPPVYLLAEDLLLLEQFLKKRQEFPYAKGKSYLVVSCQTQLNDAPLQKEYICRKVRSLTNCTPQRLRITCYSALSALYGPQYLVEAFGLSLTQAARYGNFQEFLLEEEVKQQREEFLELSRQLEQSEKQRAPRSHHKKEEVKHGSTKQ